MPSSETVLDPLLRFSHRYGEATLEEKPVKHAQVKFTQKTTLLSYISFAVFENSLNAVDMQRRRALA